MYVLLIRYVINGSVGIVEDKHMAVLWGTEQDAIRYAENSQLLTSGKLVWSVAKAPELPTELSTELPTNPFKGSLTEGQALRVSSSREGKKMTNDEPPVKKSRDTGLGVEECYQPYGAFVIHAWAVEPYQLHCSTLSLGAISIEDAVRATHDFIESTFKNVEYRLFLTQAFEQVHEAPYVVHWGPDGQPVWSGTADWFRLLKQQEIEQAKNRKGA